MNLRTGWSTTPFPGGGGESIVQDDDHHTRSSPASPLVFLHPGKQHLQEEADEADVMMYGASFGDIEELYFTSCQGIDSPFSLYYIY